MHQHTTVYLDTDDLEASAVSPVFTDTDGRPWATITLGGPIDTPGVITVHVDPRDGCHPLTLAEHLERLANDLRTEFSRWVAKPESDLWCTSRSVVATAEAITTARNVA